MKVLDLFAGAGGFSLGFRLSGFQVLGGVEIDEWASDTFRYNHPSATVLTTDITLLTDDELLDAFPDKPDIIIGGPPCQGFSICVKNAGDPKDPRNSLFMEMIRATKLFSPSIVVIENVPNLLKARTAAKTPVVAIMEKEFQRLGYFVYYTVLNATDYGVPQIRKRFILIASKTELAQPFPAPTHSVGGENSLKVTPTLWDAISDLPDIEAREGSEVMAYDKAPLNDYQNLLRAGSDVVHNHKAMNHSKRTVQRFSVMKWGQSVSDVPDSLKPYKRNSKGEISGKAYDQNNRRMYPNAPCHTIPASFYANFVHPYKNRNFTAREGARIQSFPDWYVFQGKPTVVSRKLLEREGRISERHLCQYNQIGNAVPPLLAKAVADNLKDQL